MEEQPHCYEEAAEDTDPDYTTPSGVGDDTTDGAAEDATTDDGSARTDGSQPKRQRKDRRPNVLGTVKEEFTEVNSDGHPTAPKHVVKGYSVQLGCILLVVRFFLHLLGQLPELLAAGLIVVGHVSL